MGMAIESTRPLIGAHVLVADDEILIALDIEDIFRRAGADIIGPCGTLREAREAAEIENVSAAVLDVRLGRDTTAPVARRLAQRNIPFIFYTGQALPADMREAFSNAIVFSKPSPVPRLVRAISELLAAAR